MAHNDELARGAKVELKEPDDIRTLSAWKNVDKQPIDCPKCDNEEAYYKMVQTRSADEPSTIFYRCTSNRCQYEWKEG
jgi:DNA-directed RNA polymerase III subunit RPC11